MVSIHAPTKGATSLIWIDWIIPIVSIHAPTKGATSTALPHLLYRKLFQSTLPRRERLLYPHHSPHLLPFQSTLPRRERQQFQPKISSDLQQKSTNYHFKYLIFPFFHPLFVYTTRHLCTFKSANPPAFLCVLLIRTLILSQNQCVIYCNSAIDTHMFHFCLIFIS